MHLPTFAYLSPTSIKDACSLLSQYDGQARVLAGGTDLLVKMKNRRMLPSCLVSIKRLPDLDYIRYDKAEGLKIGALTSLTAINSSTIVRQVCGVVTQAASVVGSAPIRNCGTIGGNLCNAAPSAETAPALIASGASVKMAALGGERVVRLEDFFTGPGRTVLQEDEIVIEVQIPNQPSATAGVYLKHSVRPMDIAVVGVAVLLTLRGSVCDAIKIALGAVGPTPMRAKKAEQIIRGNEPTEELIAKAAVVASEESHPIDDIRSSADHRRNMVQILTAHAIAEAAKHARSVSAE